MYHVYPPDGWFQNNVLCWTWMFFVVEVMFGHMLYVSGIIELVTATMCSHTLCHIYTHKRCRWCYGSHPLTDYCSSGLVSFSSKVPTNFILFYFILLLFLACYVKYILGLLLPWAWLPVAFFVTLSLVTSCVFCYLELGYQLHSKPLTQLRCWSVKTRPMAQD
jgi:hypothetical protein